MLDTDKTAPTDTLAPKLDMTDTSTLQLEMTGKEHNIEGMKDENITPMYNMMEQE